MRDDYLFDYRLDNESDAIGKGNPELCPDEARYDRYGNDRWAEGALDLGAYVWVYVPDEDIFSDRLCKTYEDFVLKVLK